VKEDAGKRIGEIVMLAMQLDAAVAQPLMLAWMQRDNGGEGGGGSSSKNQLGAMMAMGRMGR